MYNVCIIGVSLHSFIMAQHVARATATADSDTATHRRHALPTANANCTH